MLDLQPGVHLEEEELVTGHHELDRAGADIPDLTGQADRRRGHLVAQIVGDSRRRRLLNHLLVPALDRAFALEQVHHVAVRVPEHLYLDMPCLLEVALNEHGVVAEGTGRFAFGRCYRFVEVLGPVHRRSMPYRHRRPRL